MKRKIAIQINCGQMTCGKCRFLTFSDNRYSCFAYLRYNERLEREYKRGRAIVFRQGRCLAAEIKPEAAP